MAQHDYIIANQSGAAFRADLNNALAAIVSQNSGATEPATTYAYQWWADTTAGLLKLRNAANNAWITLRELDGTLTIEDGTASSPGLAFADDLNTGIYSPSADQLGITTGGTVRLTTTTTGITSALPVDVPLGAVGTPSLTFTGDLNTGIYSPGADQVAISTNGVERVEFGTGEVVFNDGGENYDFRIEGDTNANLFFVDASTDRVGLGTSAPLDTLQVGGDSTSHIAIANTGSTDVTSGIRWRYGGAGTILSQILSAATGVGSNTYLSFHTSGTGERMRINAIGQVGIGTTSPGAALDVVGGTAGDLNNPAVFIENNKFLTFRQTSTNWGMSLGCDSSNNSNILGLNNLIFLTGSSATERMRINNAGNISSFADSANPSYTIRNASTAGTSTVFIQGLYSASSTTSGGTASIYVFTNGNIQNTNNSYGALSDIKLKENIVDANSQWNDLKALQVRKYNFKEGQTHTQIGLVAQEVELVSPGLVSESPDRDEDGNDLGTVTKSVNYSVLYMKAVKALQEAMERIEQLETEMAEVKTQLQAS